MLDNILEREDVIDLLKEICNSPKYYKKNDEANLNREYILDQNVLLVFYDALYKYKIIIESEDYLTDYIIGLERLIKKLDKIEDIKIGICKLIIKFVSLKINDESRENILNYIYDKYIVNGYYFLGVSNKDFLNIGEIGIKSLIDLDVVDELIEIFKKYNIEINYDKDLVLTTNFINSCIDSINYPKYLSHLVSDFERQDKSSYYNYDYSGCLNNLNKIFDNLFINDSDKKRVTEIFKMMWNIYKNGEKGIYLVLVKRNEISDNVIDFSLNSDFSIEDEVLHIFSSYDDYVNLGRSIDREKLEFISLTGYYKYTKKEDKSKKKFEIVEDDFKLENKYGKSSLLFIFGTLFIIVGVILTIIFS